MAAAPPQGICELLRSFVGIEADTRKAAEQKLEEALKTAPNQLVAELVAVLAASGEGGAAVELRQEAVVLLRQCTKVDHSHYAWTELDNATRQLVKTQLLSSIQQDTSNPVRRNSGSAISCLADNVAEDFDQLMKEWPELMPGLAAIVGQGDPAKVAVALSVMKDLVHVSGAKLLEGPQTLSMLQITLAAAPEVQAASAELVFKFVEILEPDAVKPLGAVMPAVYNVVKQLATSNEDLIKEVLEALIEATDEEPEFFKENGLEQLWPLLVEICKAQHWADSDVRHSGMEAVMSIFEGLCEDFCKPQGLPFLEQLVGLNIEWMLEVEESVDTWTAAADAKEDDDIDGDAVTIGEENLDRLAETCAEKELLEEAFMPLLVQRVIQSVLAEPNVSWQKVRACVMAVSQCVEYISEDSWVDQCVTLLLPHVNHEHPRVRFSAFTAIGQLAYDQESVAENHHETVMPAILQGLDDSNVRVATEAVKAFSSVGEDLEEDDLEPHMEGLMTKLFTRLQQGQTRSLQEACLGAIAVVGESAEEHFTPYYGHVMPALKQIIANSKADDLRTLRGKAFECVSMIGEAVGKETFAADAHEVMKVMVGYFQAGFAPDDESREFVFEASGRVASVLGPDFKPYMPGLLPPIFAVLNQRPEEVTPEKIEDDDDDELNTLEMDGKLVGLKTSVLDEMAETLTLITTLIEALAEEFLDFMQPICTSLMPLLEFPLSSSIEEKALGTWQQVVSCARIASEKGKCDKSIVGELVSQFLKCTVPKMAKLPSDPKEQDEQKLAMLESEAIAASGVLKNAGAAVLARNDIVDLVKLLVQLLDRITITSDEKAEIVIRKRNKEATDEDSDEEDSSDDESEVSRQSVRFSLVDVAGALMRSSREVFMEVGVPTLMELVKCLLQPQNGDVSKCIGLYIANDIVECMGPLSVPFWNIFMEQAVNCITDKSPAVRRYSALLAGHGAREQAFAQIAPHAAAQVARVLQKHGEKHKRRRAATSDAKQTALAVDSSIWALGMMCEHQEQNVGGDVSEAWKLWLRHMPPRCDREIGQKASAQLLELVVRQHSVLTAPQNLGRVLEIFADVYKGRSSNPVLDKEIAAAIARAGSATVQNFAANFPERQRKKIETILKDGASAN